MPHNILSYSLILPVAILGLPNVEICISFDVWQLKTQRGLLQQAMELAGGVGKIDLILRSRHGKRNDQMNPNIKGSLRSNAIGPFGQWRQQHQWGFGSGLFANAVENLDDSLVQLRCIGTIDNPMAADSDHDGNPSGVQGSLAGQRTTGKGRFEVIGLMNHELEDLSIPRPRKAVNSP